MANVVCELLNLHPSAQPEDECLVQKHLLFVILNEFFLLLKFLSHFDNSNSNWSLSTLSLSLFFFLFISTISTSLELEFKLSMQL